MRVENRGAAFGSEPGNAAALVRTRFSLSYRPAGWIEFAGMAQDARAPWYGPDAPASVRDSADLHEAYFELFPGERPGFGMTAGRKMLTYGDGRLIGSPQWGNTSRSFDHARLYWRWPGARVELFMASPVKIRVGEPNRPALNDRVWGMYNTFSGLRGGNVLDVYLMRRDRRADGRGVNTTGFRAARPSTRWGYSLEGAVQTGRVGETAHRAAGWSSSLTRRVSAGGRALDLTAEYKYASPDFDQIYPSNHDRFGHQDLFSWRNIHDASATASLQLTKRVTLNLMHHALWVASKRGGPMGATGSHIGKEADLFATYAVGRSTFGAGYGYLFRGGYLRSTAPGAGPSYVYIFHCYAR